MHSLACLKNSGRQIYTVLAIICKVRMVKLGRVHSGRRTILLLYPDGEKSYLSNGDVTPKSVISCAARRANAPTNSLGTSVFRLEKGRVGYYMPKGFSGTYCLFDHKAEVGKLYGRLKFSFPEFLFAPYRGNRSIENRSTPVFLRSMFAPVDRHALRF